VNLLECSKVHVVQRLVPYLQKGKVIMVKKLEKEELDQLLSNHQIINHVKGEMFAMAFENVTGHLLPPYDSNEPSLDDCIVMADISIRKLLEHKEIVMDFYLIRYLPELRWE
jgi:hypothetical protein